MRETIRVSAVNARVGSEDEPGSTLFASVADVALDAQSILYVLEPSLAEIRSFDSAGRHIATFGRRGRGPGEFVSPISVAHDGRKSLFVVQFGFGITEIRTDAGKMSYRRQFGQNKDYASICSMGDRIFVGAGGDSGVVRELDGERNEIRAFGEPFYSHENPKVQHFARRSGARLDCHAPSQTIYAAAPTLGTLRAYHVSGELKWEMTLPNFQYVQFGPDPQGGVYSTWAADALERVVVVDERRLVLSVSRRDFSRAANPRSRAPSSTVNPSIVAVVHYVVDARTGRLLSKSVGEPAFKASNSTIGVQVLQEPWPMLQTRTLTAVPR